MFNTPGDLFSAFQSMGIVLSSYNSKVSIPINLFNRKNRKVNYAILELLIEAKRVTPEWRLKVENVNITRQFKPTHYLAIGDGERGLYKFVYDVTSILNASEVISKEWVNILIKYEGGDPFAVKYILLDAIYDEIDAYTNYKHSTGLLVLEPGERYHYPIEEHAAKSLNYRLVTYTPRQSEIKLYTRNSTLAIRTQQEGAEDHTLTFSENPGSLTLELNAPLRSYAVISSITAYNCSIKEPRLELCNLDYSLSGNKVLLKLRVCNKGESSPDRLVISIMSRGNVLCSIQDPEVNIPPGGEIERTIEVPKGKFNDVNIRLVWFKSTRRWLRDEVLKFH